MVLGSSSGKPFPGPLSGKPHRKNSLGRRVRERAPVNGSGKWLRETVPELGKWHPGSGIREVASGKWHPGSWPVKRHLASGIREVGPLNGKWQVACGKLVRQVAPGKWHPGSGIRQVAPVNSSGTLLRETVPENGSGKWHPGKWPGKWHMAHGTREVASGIQLGSTVAGKSVRHLGPEDGPGRMVSGIWTRDFYLGFQTSRVGLVGS